MFDYLHHRGRIYQTKDTPAQFLDHYELRDDGTLWHQDYDIEDRGDPSAEGIMRLQGMLTPVNKRWVPTDFTGALRFYCYDNDVWEEYHALFERGSMVSIVKEGE